MKAAVKTLLSRTASKALSLGERAFIRPGPVADLARARHVLFLHHEKPLGTAVIATATLRKLKHHRPDIRISVAASGPPAQLLKCSPFIDELLISPSPFDDPAGALRFAWGTLRPLKADLVMLDTGNARTAVALTALAAGSPARAGFCVRPGLMNHALQVDRSLSNIANNLRLLEPFGISHDQVEPFLHFGGEDLETAQGLLPANAAPRIAMVTRTSAGHPNAWFDERFVEVSRRLVDDLGAQLVFVGAPGDVDAIDAMRGNIARDTISAAGRTNLTQLAALLSQCDLAVTVDTGGLHMARGVELPTVVLGNAAQPDWLWLPPATQELHDVIRKDAEVSCAICWRMHCATRECMQAISVDEVVARAVAQLERFPASGDARTGRAERHLAPALP